MLRLSVTRVIFSALGYRVSEVYLSIYAKSNAVRLCVTTVSFLPAGGSEIIKTSVTPLRIYTKSTFSGRPDSQGMRVSFMSCLFHLCRQQDGECHMDTSKHPAHLPFLPRTQHLPPGCTIPLQAMV